jgi:hypothetical protein
MPRALVAEFGFRKDLCTYTEGAVFKFTDSVFNAVNKRCVVIFCNQQKLMVVQIKFCWTNYVSGIQGAASK